MQPYWKIALHGRGSADSGYVHTRDGEIIGRWTADAEGHQSFIPNGASEPILFSMWIPEFCRLIVEWYEAQPGNEPLTLPEKVDE